MKTSHLKNLCKQACAYANAMANGNIDARWKFIDTDKCSYIEYLFGDEHLGLTNISLLLSEIKSKHRRYVDLLMKLSECTNTNSYWNKSIYADFPKFSSIEELDMLLQISNI